MNYVALILLSFFIPDERIPIEPVVIDCFDASRAKSFYVVNTRSDYYRLVAPLVYPDCSKKEISIDFGSKTLIGVIAKGGDRLPGITVDLEKRGGMIYIKPNVEIFRIRGGATRQNRFGRPRTSTVWFTIDKTLESKIFFVQ